MMCPPPQRAWHNGTVSQKKTMNPSDLGIQAHGNRIQAQDPGVLLKPFAQSRDAVPTKTLNLE